jgi:hypothetical protein
LGLATPKACVFDSTPANAVFTSAVVAQGLAAGDPQLTFFHFYCVGRDCLINSTLGNASPVYYDYSYVLSHMDVSRIYNVTSSGSTAGTWMVLGATDTGLNQSLLIANANSSNWENVTVTPAVPAGWIATVYCEGSYGALSTEALPSTGIVTVENASTCVVQAASPCATPGCGVSMLAAAKNSGTGSQEVGPVNATAHNLLYLAIQQDYSSGTPPTITDGVLTWSLRTYGATSPKRALWLYTSTVPNNGLSWHNFTVKAADSLTLGYVLMDFPGFAGFDPNVGSIPSANSYSSTTPTYGITTNSEAAYIVFISTIAATGGSPSLSPLPGQDIFNGNPTPSYAVSCVYGVYTAGTETVGGTLNVSHAGWVIADAIDLSVTMNASVREISTADNLNGTQTTPSFGAEKSDLLYLAIAQDYDSGAAPTVIDSVLTWSPREHGGATGAAATWVYTSVVPSGGLSGHTFTVKAADGLRFGYLLVDLRGFSGFDTNVSSLPAAAAYSASTSPSARISTNFQAIFLAFVSTISATGTISLTPNGDQDVLNSDPSPSYAVSLLYSMAPSGATTLGGTFSTSETGWIISDAVDIPNSGNASVTFGSSDREPSGSLAVPIVAGSGDLIYLAIAQDADAGSPPLLTVTSLTWTLRGDDVTVGGSALWIYTAEAPYGGISGAVTITAADGLGWGELTVVLNDTVGLDRNHGLPGAASYTSSKPVSISVSATYNAAYLAFVSTSTATGSITLTPDSGEHVINSDPSPSYQVALIYTLGGAGTQTVGGGFNVAETGWIVSDAVDL